MFTEFFYGDRSRIQTCNPHIRSVVLYSVELCSHGFSLESAKIGHFFKTTKAFGEKDVSLLVNWLIG